jgi:hypothetical protein
MTAADRIPQPLTDELLAEIDGRSAHLYEYVELPDEADIVVGQDVPALLAEVQRLKGELAKYVGAEPTIAEEMAHLSSCLDAVHALCDEAGAKGITSGGTFTVDAVRDAADGIRPDNPKDRRRRIYIDGKGNAWLDQSVTSDGTRWIAPLAGAMPSGIEPEGYVRTRTGSLREIGRCW